MGNDIAVDTALKRFYIKPCYAREIKRKLNFKINLLNFPPDRAVNTTQGPTSISLPKNDYCPGKD